MEYVANYFDNAVRQNKLQTSIPMGSMSRSEFFHRIEEQEDLYQPFDIGAEMVDPVDPSLQIPQRGDERFRDRELPERSMNGKKRKRSASTCIIRGTQELMHDRVKDWRPHGRIIDAAGHDTPKLGKIKLDLIMREANMGGELSIMALGVMKKLLLGNNLALKEFTPDEKGQCLEFGVKVMRKQPWRPHVFVVLSDTRRFVFFKVSRLENDSFKYQHSPMLLDVAGWDMFARLVSQTAETLGYVQCSINGWKVGDIIGVGGTAVVVNVTPSDQSQVGAPSANNVLAKLYTGQGAAHYMKQEALALDALKDVPNIPRLVDGAPTQTISGRPVLLIYPRGYSVGDGIFPWISDYAPLVDVLQAIHNKGWLHNDVAPANIFFTEGVNGSSPQVFLNDFGSATNAKFPMQSVSIKSRPLFYSTDGTSGFEFSVKADLRALVLSIFVMMHKHSVDSVKVERASQLEDILMQKNPWKRALIAAQKEDYNEIKDVLYSTVTK